MISWGIYAQTVTGMEDVYKKPQTCVYSRTFTKEEAAKQSLTDIVDYMNLYDIATVNLFETVSYIPPTGEKSERFDIVDYVTHNRNNGQTFAYQPRSIVENVDHDMMYTYLSKLMSTYRTTKKGTLLIDPIFALFFWERTQKIEHSIAESKKNNEQLNKEIKKLKEDFHRLKQQTPEEKTIRHFSIIDRNIS